jgi:hypothetical protein
MGAIPVHLVPWQACVAVQKDKAVDEALTNFKDDPTSDNATCLIRSVFACIASMDNKPMFKAATMGDDEICEVLKEHGIRTHGRYNDGEEFLLGDAKKIIAAIRQLTKE